MPDKPLTVASYAAGASLAAITLVYVFGPTYFIDSVSNSARKRAVVGLANPANDCFINSILQALAGLTDLRVYLIRETHRRALDEPWVYKTPVQDPAVKNAPDWKLEGMQNGMVTKGLKEILDALNERPIYKKTISAAGFVKVLEVAFRQRISRQQQDAQEFLQVVAERLCDEHHAAKRARQAAKRKASANGMPAQSTAAGVSRGAVEDSRRLAALADNGDRTLGPVEPKNHARVDAAPHEVAGEEEDDGFPMEGKYKSEIECKTCGFRPKPTESTFCTLTLNVPQCSSTTLDICLDSFFMTEYVDDFKCEKCRLLHAKEVLEAELSYPTAESLKATMRQSLARLQSAIDSDPEKCPRDVVLPDMQYAPKRRIARHTRITSFPKVMAIHLSRSIYDASQMSQKNSAKVQFPERLVLGGILNQKKYKLLGVVTHKGSHHSGHYESFRRQNFSTPFSNPNAFQQSGIFTKSVHPSPEASVRDLLSPSPHSDSADQTVENGSQQPADIPSRSGPTSQDQATSRSGPSPAPLERDPDTFSLRSVAASARSTVSKISQSAKNSRPVSPAGDSKSTRKLSDEGKNAASRSTLAAGMHNGASPSKPKRRKHAEKWWRISDEKVREAKTSEVLGMQREVYLLFYELERESASDF